MYLLMPVFIVAIFMSLGTAQASSSQDKQYRIKQIVDLCEEAKKKTRQMLIRSHVKNKVLLSKYIELKHVTKAAKRDYRILSQSPKLTKKWLDRRDFCAEF